MKGDDYFPDVYYVILDTYGSASMLREFYDFENSGFITSLQNRGFFVAEESFSNYAMTTLSLASSLNMYYLDRLSPELGESPKNYETPR